MFRKCIGKDINILINVSLDIVIFKCVFIFLTAQPDVTNTIFRVVY